MHFSSLGNVTFPQSPRAQAGEPFGGSCVTGAHGNVPAVPHEPKSGGTDLRLPGCVQSRRKTGPGPVALARLRKQLGVTDPGDAARNDIAPKVSDFMSMWASHPAAERLMSIARKAFADSAEPSPSPGSSSADGTCEVSPPTARQRRVEQLIGYAKGEGFKVELSDGLRQALERDPGRSLEGVVVLIGDTDHIDEALQRTIENMVSRHFRHGGFFAKGDDMLAEVNWRLCRGDEWHSWWHPFNSPCVRADDEALKAQVDAAFGPAKEAALVFLETIGKRVHDAAIVGNAALEAAKPYIDVVLRNPASPPDHLAAAQALDQAWRKLDVAVAETREGRETMQREMAMTSAGGDHATFLVVGDRHARRLFKDLAPTHEVLYLRKA